MNQCRFWSNAEIISPKILLIEPPFPQEPVEFGPSWWDAFVGVKTFNRIGANWDFEFYGTLGYGESDWPWTLQAMFSRRFSNDNRLGLGARVWGIDYSDKDGFSGPRSHQRGP